MSQFCFQPARLKVVKTVVLETFRTCLWMTSTEDGTGVTIVNGEMELESASQDKEVTSTPGRLG